MDGITTHALSYMPVSLPVKQQYPWTLRKYTKSNVPTSNDTTHKLSYVPPALPVKENYPWAMRKYVQSNVKIANDTIQKLSYIPPGTFIKVGCNCEYAGECLSDSIPQLE